MFSLCHPWFTTTNLSYTFPILETSATASCGSTDNLFRYLYIYISYHMWYRCLLDFISYIFTIQLRRWELCTSDICVMCICCWSRDLITYCSMPYPLLLQLLRPVCTRCVLGSQKTDLKKSGRGRSVRTKQTDPKNDRVVVLDWGYKLGVLIPGNSTAVWWILSCFSSKAKLKFWRNAFLEIEMMYLHSMVISSLTLGASTLPILLWVPNLTRNDDLSGNLRKLPIFWGFVSENF